MYAKQMTIGEHGTLTSSNALTLNYLYGESYELFQVCTLSL